MLNFYTFSKFLQFTRTFLDIIILSFILYYSIKIVRNNSRTAQIFKGIIFVVLLNGLASMFGLKSVSTITEIFVTWGFLAIIIIFQPEIRAILEKLGKTSVFSKIATLSGSERGLLIQAITKATQELSEKKTGALITIEQAQSLSDFIKTGTQLDSVVTAELLMSIFVTSTPLHDGAVIIQGDKIACASAYFPPTEKELPSRYGARHRAAIGISEITDSITIVVSEETGVVSVAEAGELTTLTIEKLQTYLAKAIIEDEIDITMDTAVTNPEVDKFEALYEADAKSLKPEPERIFDIFRKKPKSQETKENRVKKTGANKKVEAKAVYVPTEDTKLGKGEDDGK